MKTSFCFLIFLFVNFLTYIKKCPDSLDIGEWLVVFEHDGIVEPLHYGHSIGRSPLL